MKVRNKYRDYLSFEGEGWSISIGPGEIVEVPEEIGKYLLGNSMIEEVKEPIKKVKTKVESASKKKKIS